MSFVQVGTLLADTKRRHEALIDDREGLETTHRGRMNEMMAELNSKKNKIKYVSALCCVQGNPSKDA